MKTIVTIVISLYMASALVIRAADPKTNWANNCAQCHGVKQGGKTTMKAFGGKLTDDEIKALVAYVRTLKK